MFSLHFLEVYDFQATSSKKKKKKKRSKKKDRSPVKKRKEADATADNSDDDFVLDSQESQEAQDMLSPKDLEGPPDGGKSGNVS